MSLDKKIGSTFCAVSAAMLSGSYPHLSCLPFEICQPATVHQPHTPHRHPAPVKTTQVVVEATTTSSALSLAPVIFRVAK
jgi:hypothetical protein